MAEKTATVTAIDVARRYSRSDANRQTLETLGQLLHRCQSLAGMLDVEDDDSKRELIDALAIADLSVLRMRYHDD